MPESRQLPDFLEALGSGDPTPGGGAAAAVTGALAAALAEMVAHFTVGRPRYAGAEESMRQLLVNARMLRGRLLDLAEDDERAYAQVSAAYKLPKTTEAERETRDEAIQAGLRAAMRPPLDTMALACDVLELASEAASAGNASVVSDAGCAAVIGEGAVRAAALNVLANIAYLKDAALAESSRRTVRNLEEQAEALRERTLAAVHARMK